MILFRLCLIIFAALLLFNSKVQMLWKQQSEQRWLTRTISVCIINHSPGTVAV